MPPSGWRDWLMSDAPQSRRQATLGRWYAGWRTFARNRLAVSGLVTQCSGLRFDGYPTLFFDVHRVKHLRLHLAVFESTATLNNAVSERRFAMVDVRNDGEISYVIHQREHLSD